MRTAAIAVLLFASILAAQPAFEVALIKPNNSGEIQSSSSTDGGLLKMTNISLTQLIESAYGRTDQTLSGPDWLSSVRFDIAARINQRVTREDRRSKANGEETDIDWHSGPGNARASCRNVSLAILADFLSGQEDRPVVDQTGIPGAYDLTLEWSKEQKADDAGPSSTRANPRRR